MMYWSRFSAGSVSESKSEWNKDCETAVTPVRYILFILLLLLSGCDTLFDHAYSSSDSLLPEEIYANPGQIDTYLQILSEQYETCRYIPLGNSTDGEHQISKIVINGQPETTTRKPAILIIGTIHGDEQAAAYIPLKLAQLLTSSENAKVQTALDLYEFHILPVLNPWGLDNNHRFTADSVDLNRNFSWAWTADTYHGTEPFDQKESQIVRADVADTAYSLSIAFHAGAACISTPWDYIGTKESEGEPETYPYETFLSDYMPNAEKIFSYAREYETDVVIAGNDSFYSIEGFDWYPCYGTIGDWLYGARGIVSYTIELSTRKIYYPEHRITPLWDQHRAALLNLFTICSTGVAGFVRDEKTLEGIQAYVSVEKISRRAQDPVEYTLCAYSDPDDGFFHILSDPGEYCVQITANGYETHTATISVGTTAGKEVFYLGKSK